MFMRVAVVVMVVVRMAVTAHALGGIGAQLLAQAALVALRGESGGGQPYAQTQFKLHGRYPFHRPEV